MVTVATQREHTNRSDEATRIPIHGQRRGRGKSGGRDGWKREDVKGEGGGEDELSLNIVAAEKVEVAPLYGSGQGWEHLKRFGGR